MTNMEFFQIVKENMREYFANNGYADCKIYKGKRNAICFEKKVDFYTVYIEFHWQTLIERTDTFDFSIGFIKTLLLSKPGWGLWSFKTRRVIRTP